MLSLTACAQANYKNLVYTEPTGSKIHIDKDASFTVHAPIIDRTTEYLWQLKIDNITFVTALETTLKKLGLYEAMGPKYEIKVKILEIKQPTWGASYSVETLVEYEVLNRISREVAIKEIVKSEGSASFYEAFFAANRLMLATERSGRENIKAFISRLVDAF